MLGVTAGGRRILSASFPAGITLHGNTSSLCFSQAWDKRHGSTFWEGTFSWDETVDSSFMSVNMKQTVSQAWQLETDGKPSLAPSISNTLWLPVPVKLIHSLHPTCLSSISLEKRVRWFLNWLPGKWRLRGKTVSARNCLTHQPLKTATTTTTTFLFFFIQSIPQSRWCVSWQDADATVNVWERFALWVWRDASNKEDGARKNNKDNEVDESIFRW